MPLFFITFFSLYALMHLYFFMKLRRAFVLSRMATVLIAVNLALLTFSPIAARVAAREMILPWAYPLNYAAYCWLAFMFLFCSVSAAWDAGRLLRWIGYRLFSRRKRAKARKTKKPERTVFVIPALLSLTICIYGYFEAHSIRTETITIPTTKLTERIRIVQISDLHLGVTVREDQLRRVISAIKHAQPDMLVGTGDLVDIDDGFLDGMDRPFQEIRPRLGKYAVLGNHEFLWNTDDALAFFARAGFRTLRGETLSVDGQIVIAGVDDPHGARIGRSRTVNEKKLLGNLPGDRFILLLKHRPLVDPDVLGMFDLQLSGHTHRGQIFPFSVATWLYYPKHAGKLHLLDGSYLYVNRGSGTWGPPIRFLAPPEVTVIDLVPGKPAGH